MNLPCNSLGYWTSQAFCARTVAGRVFAANMAELSGEWHEDLAIILYPEIVAACGIDATNAALALAEVEAGIADSRETT